MNSSESVKELAKALSLAQREIDGAKKESENPFFKSRYADLSSVWESCRDHLTKNGLSVVQLPGNDGDMMTLETVLLHESGQWISSVCAMKPVKNDPQSCGSCLSYLRRYCLSAVVGGCSTESDDDGNAASNPEKPEVKKKTTGGETKFQKYLKSMSEMKESIGAEKYRAILGAFGFEHSNQVTEYKKQKEIYGEMLTVKKGIKDAVTK